ncbi:S1 family peptidase [Mucilaginibacter sp.]|uniref:S1 family peptidase n=1 Tax=Mucilaginibacter sp. TaxID=1882438 RepID=UPI003D149249
MTVDKKRNLDSFGLLCPNLATAIVNMVKYMSPELRGSIPFVNGWHAFVYHEDDLMIVLLQDSPGVEKIESIKPDYLNFIKGLIKELPQLDFETIYAETGDRFYSVEMFSYFGPSYINESVSDIFAKTWPTLGGFLGAYIQDVLIPKLYDLEKEKIQKILPPPQTFDLKTITQALWVLESDELSVQGTAFALKGHGLVTCEHVLGPDTHAFQINEVNKKYPVKVLKKHEVIDLAILEIQGFNLEHFLEAEISEVKQMDQITVAGFPNYQIGDTGTIITGNISGFRIKSGIRRLLVSTPLIAGTSGGPVLNALSKVIGIAVTGAERMSQAHKTEEHGGIPVSAIDLL